MATAGKHVDKAKKGIVIVAMSSEQRFKRAQNIAVGT
jgi:hypothetical protein